jgi:hypothetical protein
MTDDPKLENAVKAITKTMRAFSAMDKDDPQRAQLRGEVLHLMDDVLEHLKAKTGRDPREPGKQEKEAFEEKLRGVVSRHFHRQARTIRRKLEAWNPDRKALEFKQWAKSVSNPGTKASIDIPWLGDADLWDDPEFDADLVLTLIQAGKHGIELFEESALIGIDYTLVNAGAAKWARKYTFELVKGIDDTTRAALQKSISSFVETPGMTIGDVMKLLPFDEKRAERMAISEITRAYGTANQLAGEQMAKEYPDLDVIKHWFTNNDDRVCTTICEPLNGVEVGIDKEFSPGVDQPPAHVGCRCWMDTTTRVKK